MGELINIVSPAKTDTRPTSQTQLTTGPQSQKADRTEKTDAPPTPNEVRAALRENGDRVSFGNRTVEFSYDEDLDRVVVKVMSSETEPPTVVRQIPSEEYLTFAARYRELQGILFDHEV